MKISFFFLFTLYTVVSTAQMINTKPQDATVGTVNFNPDFIKKNKIKSVVISILDKPDGTIITDKGETKGYEFDKTGYVTRYFYTILNSTQTETIEVPATKQKGRITHPAHTRTLIKYINDTCFINVFYDNQKRIITKRVRSGDYYDAYYYEYNESGQIQKQLHCKETNISENKSDFKLGVQTVLSSETYQYTKLTPTQLRKICLNDEGREYKKGIINYDSKGNKISDNYEFIVSWMHTSNTWQYDEKNKVVKHTYTGNEAGEINEASIFEYEKNTGLNTETQFKNNELTKEINYLYDENGLIKSEANRDHTNASVIIAKYAYTFYP